MLKEKLFKCLKSNHSKNLQVITLNIKLAKNTNIHWTMQNTISTCLCKVTTPPILEKRGKFMTEKLHEFQRQTDLGSSASTTYRLGKHMQLCIKCRRQYIYFKSTIIKWDHPCEMFNLMSGICKCFKKGCCDVVSQYKSEAKSFTPKLFPKVILDGNFKLLFSHTLLLQHSPS